MDALSVSRFAYVAYDKQAAQEQNDLRAKFKTLECKLLNNDADFLETIHLLPIPNNIYAGFARQLIGRMLILSPSQDKDDLLIILEQLYYVLGKEIRLNCLKRV